ncbi:hypothetical protein BC830DRAFT_1163042 [Chytriomyces sp. MP71]|nr:hypothetical protein BC830DRAFT_1163042 [Chytriomyces sp. MP71]
MSGAAERAIQLQLEVKQLENALSQAESGCASRDKAILNLNSDIQAARETLSETESERARIEVDLQETSMRVITLQIEIDSLKESLEATKAESKEQGEVHEAAYLALKLSSDKKIVELEQDIAKLNTEMIDFKPILLASKNRSGELHHELVLLQGKHDILQTQYDDHQITFKKSEFRVRELEAIVDTMMRYPDASLGQSLLEEPADGRYDELFKEMINSNNLRISLLEQKNNEYRMVRLKHVDGGDTTKIGEYLSHRPPQMQLWNNQKVSDAISLSSPSKSSRTKTRVLIPQVKLDTDELPDEVDRLSTPITPQRKNSGTSNTESPSSKGVTLQAAANFLLSNDITTKRSTKQPSHPYKHHERISTPSPTASSPALHTHSLTFTPSTAPPAHPSKMGSATAAMSALAAKYGTPTFQAARGPIGGTRTHFPLDEHTRFAAAEEVAPLSPPPPPVHLVSSRESLASGAGGSVSARSSVAELLRGMSEEEKRIEERRHRQRMLTEAGGARKKHVPWESATKRE